MEPAEAYHKHDNWPPEVERALMIRIASEVPVLQDTLLRLLLIGLSKVPPSLTLPLQRRTTRDVVHGNCRLSVCPRSDL